MYAVVLMWCGHLYLRLLFGVRGGLFAQVDASNSPFTPIVTFEQIVKEFERADASGDS